MDSITITQPDDWHLHLRDGAVLKDTVRASGRIFGRAIIMPNLRPPVTTAQDALDYRQRILRYAPDGFEPLMTLYLTDHTTPEMIREASESPHVYAAKLYPSGATTNSQSGVTELEKIYETLAAMEKTGLPLLIHGEVTDPQVDVFHREAVFIEDHLTQILSDFKSLKVVLEHISTEAAVRFVASGPSNLAATITPHHLLINRNHVLAGGIRPHYYCLPIVKRRRDQLALIEAATSGNPKFFLGTDSAPHDVQAKETACGCAGIFSAHRALELYAEVFDEAGALSKLEDFASVFGPRFYGLPRNQRRVRLQRVRESVPPTLRLGDGHVVPFRGGDFVHWRAELV